MTLDDMPKFSEEIAIVFAGKGKPMEPLTAEAYWRVLGHLPFAHLRAACTAYLKSADEFPNPGKLLALVPGRINHVQSWGEVRAQIRAVGSYSPDKAEAALSWAQWQAVRTLGGWQYLCSQDSDDLTRMLSAFKAALDGAELRRAHAAEARAAALEGVADAKRLT